MLSDSNMNWSKKVPTVMIILISLISISCSTISKIPTNIKYNYWVKENISNYRSDNIESLKYISIPIVSNMLADDAWKIVVEKMESNFPLVLIDSQKYYLQTDWKKEEYPSSTRPNWAINLRSRSSCRIDPNLRALIIRIETNVWWRGRWSTSKYISKQDAYIIDEIRTKINYPHSQLPSIKTLTSKFYIYCLEISKHARLSQI